MTTITTRGLTLAQIQAAIDEGKLTREQALAGLAERAKEAQGWKLTRTNVAIAALRGGQRIDAKAAFRAALPKQADKPAKPAKAAKPAQAAQPDDLAQHVAALESAVAQIAQGVAALLAKQG